MAEELKKEYLDKCKKLESEPLLNVLKQIDEAIEKGQPLKELTLKGISKTKLNEKLDSTKVCLFSNSLWNATEFSTKLKALMRALAPHELESLDLSYNFIDDGCCKVIISIQSGLLCFQSHTFFFFASAGLGSILEGE